MLSMTRRAALAAAALLCAGASALAQEFDVQRGIEYANHDGISLQGDLYQPRESGKYPAIVAVHGGGWQGGSSAAYQHWGPWLAKRGYVVLAVKYRLSKPGQKTYPQAVQDVRAAVQHLRGKAEALKVDGERIGMMGDSAGGHLVSLVALAGDEPPFANGYPGDAFAGVNARVKAVATFYGVYDMPQQWNHDLTHRPHDNIAQTFLGAPLTDNRKLYNEASPMTYAVRGKPLPSFLLINGTEDDVVDRTQSDNFLLALKQAQVYARRVVIQGAGHYFASDPIDEPQSRSGEAAGIVLRFLRERL